jgi:hypothetical protein
VYGIAFAGNYKCIQTEDPARQSLNEWKDDINSLEMVEKSEGSVIVDEKVVKLNRNLQTGRLVEADAWGNCYEVPGNTKTNGQIIDSAKEIPANIELSK